MPRFATIAFLFLGVIAWFSAVRFAVTWGSSEAYYAAGIFPLAVDPHVGKAMVLLGLDDGSNRWADFGGLREFYETDPRATACREFIEETIGLTSMRSMQECMGAIERLQVVSPIHNVNPTEKSSFIEFFLPIEYDPNLPKRFRDVREKSANKLSSASLEKAELEWFQINQIRTALTTCCGLSVKERCVINDRLLRTSMVRTLCLVPNSAWKELEQLRGRKS